MHTEPTCASPLGGGIGLLPGGDLTVCLKVLEVMRHGLSSCCGCCRPWETGETWQLDSGVRDNEAEFFFFL